MVKHTSIWKIMLCRDGAHCVFWRIISRAPPKNRSAKGVRGPGGQWRDRVISGIQTSGGLLIRFARPSDRDVQAATTAAAVPANVAAASTSNLRIGVIIIIVNKKR